MFLSCVFLVLFFFFCKKAFYVQLMANVCVCVTFLQTKYRWNRFKQTITITTTTAHTTQHSTATSCSHLTLTTHCVFTHIHAAEVGVCSVHSVETVVWCCYSNLVYLVTRCNLPFFGREIKREGLFVNMHACYELLPVGLYHRHVTNQPVSQPLILFCDRERARARAWSWECEYNVVEDMLWHVMLFCRFF